MVVLNESLSAYDTGSGMNHMNGITGMMDTQVNSFAPNNFGNFGYKKKGKISKLLYKLAHYGLDYSDAVYKNMRAIPEDTHLMSKFDQIGYYNDEYKNFMDGYKNNPEEENYFHLKPLEEKRRILRRIAMQPELEEILDVVSNEAIVYDPDETYICEPDIDEEILDDLILNKSDELRSMMLSKFHQIYLLLDWKKCGWDQFRRWLIDGVIAYQIVYDNISNPQNIISINQIDPATLTKEVKDGITTWIQYKGQTQRQRTLLDSEIVYVKYEDTGVSTRQSYLERLVRPFNIYRIIEQAQVIWTVSQSSFKTIFTIPIGQMSRAKGMQTLNAAMNRYKEDISFNTETAELKINGKMNMPFNKEYFMPENESGTPKIESLTDGGPQLVNNDQLKYFENKLYKVSKVPVSRFNSEERASWFGTDPSQMLRDEINFSRFITRLLNDFGEIILKPLKIQMAISMPSIKADKRILNCINIKFNSYNQFEELMEAQLDQTRAQAVQTVAGALMEDIGGGVQECYLAMSYLVKKYMNMSEKDIEENEKSKIEDILRKKERSIENAKLQAELQQIMNQSQQPAGGDMGAAGGDMGGDMGAAGGDMGGAEGGLTPPPENPTGEPTGDMNGGIDTEMQGEVEPEPVDTTQNNA